MVYLPSGFHFPCWPLQDGDGSKPWYLVNPKIAGKWMFIPLKMVLIGIDPYPDGKWLRNFNAGTGPEDVSKMFANGISMDFCHWHLIRSLLFSYSLKCQGHQTKTKYHHPNGRKKTSNPDVSWSFLPPDISSIRVPRQVSVFGACNLGSQVSLQQKPEGSSGASKRNRKSRGNSYGEGSVHLLMLPWFCEQRSIHQLYVGYLGGQTTHSHISDIYGYLISDISS